MYLGDCRMLLPSVSQADAVITDPPYEIGMFGAQWSGSFGLAGGDGHRFGDDGSVARFFYCAKASKRDRGEGNTHPTVKPTELMRYLCRLITKPGDIVLDPFMGSGTTGVACAQLGRRFFGAELQPEHYNIACLRIEAEMLVTAQGERDE